VITIVTLDFRDVRVRAAETVHLQRPHSRAARRRSGEDSAVPDIICKRGAAPRSDPARTEARAAVGLLCSSLLARTKTIQKNYSVVCLDSLR
jgi:hypothetical protein